MYTDIRDNMFNYTEDTFLNDRLIYHEHTEADEWTDEARQTVLLGGKEYVKQIVSGIDSFSPLKGSSAKLQQTVIETEAMEDNAEAVTVRSTAELAAEKDETVYVVANADGTVEKIISYNTQQDDDDSDDGSGNAGQSDQQDSACLTFG